MENHESHPTGSAPFPEVNAASFNGHSFSYSRDCEHGHGHGRGRYNHNHSYNKITGNHQKWVNNKEIQEKMVAKVKRIWRIFAIDVA